MTESTRPIPPSVGEASARRSFLKKLAAVAAGCTALLAPLGSAVALVLSPVWKRSSGGSWVRIATLDQVPADGRPRHFPVVSDRVDAWSGYPSNRVGAVYLTRQPDQEKPIALSAVCPHAGCFILHSSDEPFTCPCHVSGFSSSADDLGDRLYGVSPRGMDSLEVELRKPKGAEGEEVWVLYQQFQTGKTEKMPVV